MKLDINQQRMAIITFARLNSKRLPNKVFEKIRYKPLLFHIINRIKKKSKFQLPIIVATSNRKSDDKIENFCKKKRIMIYRGDLNNVYNRSLDCFNKFSLESFVRVCADRPFFDVSLMDQMINKFNNSNFDIVSNQFPRTYPKGLGCEVAKTSIFFRIKKHKLTKEYKEHIFNYFYKNSKKYKIYNFSLSKKYSDFQNQDFSINNKSDLIKINNIYNEHKKKKYIDLLKILST